MEQYADATGLIERSAAAFTRAIPDLPGNGFFAPDSVAWPVTCPHRSRACGRC
jgi:hypothetical protein